MQAPTNAQTEASNQAESFVRGLQRNEISKTWSRINEEAQPPIQSWRDYFERVNAATVSDVVPLSEDANGVVTVQVNGAVEHRTSDESDSNVEPLQTTLQLTPLQDGTGRWAIPSVQFKPTRPGIWE